MLHDCAVRRAGLLALLFCTSFIVAEATGTVLQELSLSELTEAADEVVVARVMAKHSRWAGSQIVTDVTLSVSDVAKGPAIRGQVVWATVLGGSVNGIGMRVIGEAQFVLGEQDLLFLSRPKGRLAPAEVVGMTMGRMPVTLDLQKVPVVRSDLAGAALLTPDPSGRMHVTRSTRARPGARPLADVLSEVRALVAP